MNNRIRALETKTISEKETSTVLQNASLEMFMTTRRSTSNQKAQRHVRGRVLQPAASLHIQDA